MFTRFDMEIELLCNTNVHHCQQDNSCEQSVHLYINYSQEGIGTKQSPSFIALDKLQSRVYWFEAVTSSVVKLQPGSV